MKIYICGNPLVEGDNLPLRILPKLRAEFPNIEFVEYDSIEDLHNQKNLIILDTVEGIDKITIITDIDDIAQHKLCSMHDFDLGTMLKLMKKVGVIKEIKIIGVPQTIEKHHAFEEIKNIISNSISESA